MILITLARLASVGGLKLYRRLPLIYKGKADSDYDKRTANPRSEAPAHLPMNLSSNLFEHVSTFSSANVNPALAFRFGTS